MNIHEALGNMTLDHMNTILANYPPGLSIDFNSSLAEIEKISDDAPVVPQLLLKTIATSQRGDYMCMRETSLLINFIVFLYKLDQNMAIDKILNSK